MAKQRDYKAEYRRRQELARSRGFRSYGQQRHKIETGKAPAIAPLRIKSFRTRRAQTVFDDAFRERESDALDYSAAHAHRNIARYDPEGNAPGVSRLEYLEAYTNAFVRGPERYGAVRRTGGSEALRRYFVDITHYYSPDEYEVRYGHESPIQRRA